MATSRSILEILLRVNADKAKQELGKVDKSLDKVEKSAKESSTGFKGLNTQFLAMGAAVSGAVFGAVKLGQALWDMGKQGAIVQQTEQSFDGLLKQWDIAPSLLDDLRRAARGTVDDMTLMQGTLTLVAGTSEELGSELLKNAPRLLEVAKAANKLNPALGDTNFLYESITTGIKRNSVQILDNLGIILKQETAQQNYAKSIGKSVDQLTDEDKALATLNEVANEAGQNLINQVGGSLDAVGDSAAQLEVSLKNLKDEWNKMISGPMGDFARVAFKVIKDSNEGREANELYNESIAKGIIVREDWIAKIKETGRNLKSEEMIAWLTPLMEEYNASWRQNTRELAYNREEQRMLTGDLEETADSSDEAAKAADQFAKHMLELNRQSRNARAALEEFRQTKIDEFFDVDMGVGDLAARLFDVTQFKEAGGEALSLMVEQVKAGLAEGKITTPEAQEFFKNISVEAEAIKVKMGEIDATEAAESISEDFNIPLEEATGLIDSVLAGIDLVNSADISAITDQFDALEERRQKLMEAGEIPLEADPGDVAKRTLDGLQDQVDYLTSQAWNIEFNIITHGSIPTGGDVGGGSQYGANFIVPPGFPNDTYPMRVSSGEHVIVEPQGTVRGGGSSFYTQNVTQHFHSEGAAALGLAVVRKFGRDRLNASMGR